MLNNCICPTECEPLGCFPLCGTAELPIITREEPLDVVVFQGGIPRLTFQYDPGPGFPLTLDLAWIGLIGRLQIVVDDVCYEIIVNPISTII